MSAGRYFVIFKLILISFLLSTFALDHHEECTDPDGANGTCVLVEECQSIVNMLKRDLNSTETRFVENSACGIQMTTNFKLVCCAGYVRAKSRLPSITDCHVESSDRIYGGNKTTLKEYPWTVRLACSLVGKPNHPVVYVCGGSLISDQYVLTAAHCKTVGVTEPHSVRLGEWDIASPEDCQYFRGERECFTAYNILIQKWIVHHKYSPRNDKTPTKYDISLIKLAKQVSFSDFVKPICLPPNDEKKIYSKVDKFISVGWGKTANLTYYSRWKLFVKLPYVPHEKCSKIFNVDETQVCAGGEKGKDTCNRDSGGPLFEYDSTNNIYVLVGITSFGSSHCGTEGIPGVYTRVDYFVDWIKENVT